MHFYYRFASAAFAVAMLVGAVGFASAQTAPGTLARARALVATRMTPTRVLLRIELASTDSCHRASLESKKPMTEPPVFIAEQSRFRTGDCTTAFTWRDVSVNFGAPLGTRTVTLIAANGTFHVNIP